MMRRSPLLWFLFGLFAVYVGERSLTGNARWIVDGIGALLLGTALVISLISVVKAGRTRHRETRQAATAALLSYLVCLLGIGLYAIAANAAADATTLRTALAVIWPLVVVLGLVPAVAIELALGSMARSPQLELWRVRLAARSA